MNSAVVSNSLDCVLDNRLFCRCAMVMCAEVKARHGETAGALIRLSSAPSNLAKMGFSPCWHSLSQRNCRRTFLTASGFTCAPSGADFVERLAINYVHDIICPTNPPLRFGKLFRFAVPRSPSPAPPRPRGHNSSLTLTRIPRPSGLPDPQREPRNLTGLTLARTMAV
jgi:hypothetical protein